MEINSDYFDITMSKNSRLIDILHVFSRLSISIKNNTKL